MTGPVRAVRVFAFAAGLALVSVAAAAQTPPDPPQTVPANPPAGAARQGQRAGARAGMPGLASGTASNAEIQQLLDAFVVSKAQGALQLNNEQFNVFLPRLLALQNLQRQHRNQRNKLLADIRALIGPNAPQEVDDATISTASKALDDLEDQMQQDERRALAAIDTVLTARQRARFRLFQEQMERQKIDLLVQARAGAPVPAPAQPGRGGGF